MTAAIESGLCPGGKRKIMLAGFSGPAGVVAILFFLSFETRV
jgi:hypothetical protein